MIWFVRAVFLGIAISLMWWGEVDPCTVYGNESESCESELVEGSYDPNYGLCEGPNFDDSYCG